MTETPLGRIVRLQIQRSVMKVKGVRYDPAPLLPVEEGAIGPLGITGLHDGAHVMEVHHAAHPSGRGGGRRTLSIGFTGHYDLMQQRYGSVPLGIGGENLIVDHPGRVFAADLAGEIVIHGSAGELILTGARVAAPCPEFTSFLLGLTNVPNRDVLSHDLSFLGEGMRGFLLDGSALSQPLPVRVGDEVVLRV